MEKFVVHLLQKENLLKSIHTGSIQKIISSSIEQKFTDKVILMSSFNLKNFSFESEGITPLFLSSKGIYSLDEDIHHSFGKIESEFNVKIFYGEKKEDNLLYLFIDTENIYLHKVNSFKGRIYEKFYIESDKFEKINDYEKIVEFAEPAVKCIELLSKNIECPSPIVFSHEVFGIPAIMNAKMNNVNIRACFLSYEVHAIRDIVCSHPGHDVAFYNILRHAKNQGKSLEEVFGDRSYIYQFELMRNLYLFDYIFTIGGMLKEELAFIDKKIDKKKIFPVFRGIELDFKALASRKEEDRNTIRKVFSQKIDFDADMIFLHTTRLSISKGIWRDFRVLEVLDEKIDKNCIFVILGSSAGVHKDIDGLKKISDDYNWPVNHKGGFPDLIDYETEVWWMVNEFNKNSKRIKVLFVNQPGINKEIFNWPDGFEISNVLNGADLVFGQSIYEPYGVSQAEAALMNNVVLASSQSGFIAQFKDFELKNIIPAEYVSMGRNMDMESLRNISIEERNSMEREYSKKIADIIIERLSEKDNYNIKDEVLKRIDWNEISKNIFKNIK